MFHISHKGKHFLSVGKTQKNNFVINLIIYGIRNDKTTQKHS